MTIIGSSPTIDRLGDDFLEGRLSICLNESFLRWSKVGAPTFVHVCEFEVFSWIKLNTWGIEERLIVTDPLYPNYEPDMDDPPALGFKPGGYQGPRTPAEDLDAAVAGKPLHRYRSHGTCSHTAVMAAVLMGCRHIVTVGVGDEEGYCKAVAAMKDQTQQIPPERQREQREKQRAGTAMLREACELRGIKWTKLDVEVPC